MKALSVVCFVVSIALVTGSANAATIVNLNGVNDAANSPVVLSLKAKTYHVAPIGVSDGGMYNAVSLHLGQPNTWTHRYSFYSTDTGTTHIGGTGSGPYYLTALSALAHATPTSFSLLSDQSVYFWINDGPGGYGYAGDNAGGISLRVVPIPGALPLLGTVLAGLGLVARRKRERI